MGTLRRELAPKKDSVGAGYALVLEDNSNGSEAIFFPLLFENNSFVGEAGFGLGIIGQDDDGGDSIDGKIEGAPLHGGLFLPISFFIDLDNPASFHLMATLDIDQVEANALFGTENFGVGIGIENGTGEVRLKADITFLDPGEGELADGKIFLEELFSPTLPSSFTSDLGGEATFDLPVHLIPDTLNAVLGASPRILVDWSDISDTDTISVTTQDLDVINGLEQLAFAKLISGLRDIESNLAELEGQSLFQRNIPLLNRSLVDLTTFVDSETSRLLTISEQFGKFIDDLEKSPSKTLQEFLESRGGQNKSTSSTFEFTFDFEKDYNATLPFNLNLIELGGLDDSLVSSSGQLNVGASLDLGLEIIIGLSDPIAPTVFDRKQQPFCSLSIGCC